MAGCQSTASIDPSVSSPASAQPVTESLAPAAAPSADHQVGDQYVWMANGRAEAVDTVVAVADEAVSMEASNGWAWSVETLYFTPPVSWSGPDGTGSRVNSSGIDPLFPLEIGNSNTIAYDGVNNGDAFSGRERCVVEAEERITVPLGTFDTFRIECRRGWDLSDPSRTRVMHYAPEILRVVRQVHQARDEGPDIYELVSYPRAGEQVDQPTPDGGDGA